jgi:hypothetical protein
VPTGVTERVRQDLAGSVVMRRDDDVKDRVFGRPLKDVAELRNKATICFKISKGRR